MIRLEWVQDAKSPLCPPPTLTDSFAIAKGQARKLRVLVVPVYEGRTNKQNALFHAKVNEIARITSVDREYIKHYVKLYATGRGYPCELDDEGLPVMENGYPVPKSTKEATVEEMEILIDSMYEWAFGKGIYIEERR